VDPADDASLVARVVAESTLADGPSAASFATHLAARSLEPSQVGSLADLYLAFACLSGSETARRRLAEELWRVAISPAGGQVGDATVDDARQVVFERLVAAEDPKLASYDGRGPLGAWLRVVLAREALALAKRGPRVDRTSADWTEALADVATHADSPELAAMKDELAREVRDALKHAARSLEPRDRALLRGHLALGMSVDVLAPIHGAHRATIARWIVAARDTLVARFQEELRARTGLQRAEIASLEALVASRLDISLASVFATVRETQEGDAG